MQSSSSGLPFLTNYKSHGIISTCQLSGNDLSGMDDPFHPTVNTTTKSGPNTGLPPRATSSPVPPQGTSANRSSQQQGGDPFFGLTSNTIPNRNTTSHNNNNDMFADLVMTRTPSAPVLKQVGGSGTGQAKK